MKLRASVVVAVLVAAGLAMAFSKRQVADSKTEEWMLEHTPKSVGGYSMRGGAENSAYTYRMDDVTYRTLDPYGIVARVYQSSATQEAYDTVVIASRSKDSFHDPRVCFSAQGWALANQWSDSIQTRTRGAVPVTIVLLDSPDGRGRLAAFLYKGPGAQDGRGRFYATTRALKLAMFLEQLKGGDDLDGVFYRFIPEQSDRDQVAQTTKLKLFVAEYIDAAYEASEGYF